VSHDTDEHPASALNALYSSPAIVNAMLYEAVENDLRLRRPHVCFSKPCSRDRYTRVSRAAVDMLFVRREPAVTIGDVPGELTESFDCRHYGVDCPHDVDVEGGWPRRAQRKNPYSVRYL
jgi:hypothetical protein